MLFADVTTIYVASVGPILGAAVAIITLYRNNKLQEMEIERLKEESGDPRLLRFAEGLQKQADTNYQAWQVAEKGRQEVYQQLLDLQNEYARFRKSHLLGEEGTRTDD